MADETTFALVHGAELGAWVWDRTLRHLRRPALALDLPGRDAGPAERRTLHLVDAEVAVTDALDAAPSVVLVAHSFAGVLVPGVARRLGARLRGVVHVGATVPATGRSWLALQPLPQRAVLRALYAARPAGLRSPAEQIRRSLCHDLDEAATTTVLERSCVEPPGFLTDRVTTAPPPVPSDYIRLSDDRAHPPATQDRSIGRSGAATIHELATGHLPMLGQPEPLARLLERIADDLERDRADGPASPHAV